MFGKFIISFFLSFLFGVSSEKFAENRVKRSDIDLQTCIDNFNVHRDKIIRTQDSQNMGAKYLNEIDLGSREECLRLCCETENCDVFVFEEKNSGSCYLFHCGPPEDFKCKFTHHVNYSSAVLSVNRHLPDLESQIKLTKHEQDLTKLRKPEVETEVQTQAPEVIQPTSSTTTTTVITKEVIPNLEKGKEPEEGKKCSRYQFECRWTGECIAIYNACDGIPQCADGSDEGPELDCPPPEGAAAGVLTTAAPQTPSVQSVNNPSPVQTQHVYDVNTQPKVPPLPSVNSQPLYRPQAAPQEPPRPQQVAPPHQVDEADFLRQIPESRNMNPRIQYEQYMPQIPVQNQASWIPHQSNQIAPVVPQYPDKNTHIFNHKDNGLQVPEGAEYRYNKPKGAMQYLHRALGYSNGGNSDGPVQYAEAISRYPKITNYYGENYRQPLQQENWPDDIRYNIPPRYAPEIPQISGLPANNKKEPISYKSTPPIQPADKKIDDAANPKHVQDKMAHDLKHSKHNMEHDSSVQRANSKTEKPVIHEQYPDAVAYKLTEADDQDGEAQVPRGAVLSLSIGMIVTCVMAIMIGCRLRVVRRRLRRGGKGFAHDADYLVNGMYL